MRAPRSMAAGLLMLALLPAKAHAAIAFSYGSQCPEQNATAKAVAASFLDALIANRFIAPNTGHALIGGIVLDQVAEKDIAKDLSCQDRLAALGAYARAFNGAPGQTVTWQNARNTAFGRVTILRDYHNGAKTCRAFKLEGTADGHHYDRAGTACRHMDGNWHFE